ncbi:MAG: phosphoglycerate kinase [Clostridiales bacterium 44_9]|nr:MAG: phosphoglycerate kinase [Clostridiales bacterium 44_9]
MGRPKGEFNPAFSLAPVAKRLSELLGTDVKFAKDIIGDDAKTKAAALKDGEVERVSILSHKGHPCRVENPWPGKSVKVSYEYGRPDEVHFGEYLNIELYKEEHAELFRI